MFIPDPFPFEISDPTGRRSPLPAIVVLVAIGVILLVLLLVTTA